MSILLNTINSGPIDLSVCEEFVSYYNTGNTYTKHIIDKEINNGHYTDPKIIDIFSSNDAVVIDAGANIGLFSLHVFPACKQIHAIEPTTKHLNVFKRMVELLNITNISFHEIALNNYDGQCTFVVDEGNTTQNRIQTDGDRTIPCLTVKTFIESINEKEIDLLKIDIEGGEKNVILEDPEFDFVWGTCKNVYVEIHPPFGINPSDIVNKLSGLGYKIKFINSQFLNNNLNVLAYK